MTYPFDRHFLVPSGNINLSVHACGNPQHPVIILIHGYPDNHRVWSGVAADLARDYHVVAYDVRGAGSSDAPRRIRDYALPQLSRDLVAVMDAVSPDRPVHLAGHDWGSIQTWESVTDPALRHRIAGYTSLSGPCLDHVGHLMRHYAQTPGENLGKLTDQLASSWYIYLFQAPLVAPFLWKAWLGKHWNDILEKAEGIRAPIEENPMQTRDGVCGINLYRANMLPRLLMPRRRHTTVPVQLLVAQDDRFVKTQLQDRLELWVENLVKQDLPGSHWHLLLEEPARLADAIRMFAFQPA